jgi:hypothetical protein
MINKDFFNNQFIDSLIKANYFFNIDSVNYIKIANIDIWEFTLPKFNLSGRFDAGQTAYRGECIKYVQNHLEGITNPCLYIFQLINPDTQTIFDSHKKFAHSQDKIKDNLRRSYSSVYTSVISTSPPSKTPQNLNRQRVKY